ncbi:MAG: hypothetical protein M0010_00640 [Actinomycetota bacterium]|nr:hypothetical protein [Actinomycetota bacterium]
MSPEASVDLEAVPWSELGPTFIEQWGQSRGKRQAEHIEVTGQNGSGKSWIECAILQARAQRRGTSEIVLVNKATDDSIPLLGWPIVDTWEGVCDFRWSTFWPRTEAVGEERAKYQEARFYELLARLWQPEANTVVAVDEMLTLEQLSARLRKLIEMYWREARANGISMIAQSQRPIGTSRHQHSETVWKIVFPPADEDDLDRFAQLLGSPKVWGPALANLDQGRHEFIIRNTVTKEAFVSWVDYEIRPIPAQRDQRPRRESSPYEKKGRKRGL